MKGYSRADGRVGIRNIVAVVYLVECSHFVARRIAEGSSPQQVHLLGFTGCYPNDYALKMLKRLCTHPNVGAVLLVSLGCEGLDRVGLAETVRQSGRPVETLVIQAGGGTNESVRTGRAWVQRALREIESVPQRDMEFGELVAGTLCGASDAASGLTANPAVGRVYDRLLESGGTALFAETGELIGCERFLAQRADTPELAEQLLGAVRKASRYYAALDYGSIAPGNVDGGLTTIEEKSAGAYAKTGTQKIAGMLKPGDLPARRGLYLLDVVPDGDVRFGFPNVNDNVEITEMIATGAHLILFTTGRGTVVGSAISPVIKICANPDTYRRLSDDMDINAGRVLDGTATLEDITREIIDRIVKTVGGMPTASERLGHQEFALGYKSFEPSPPICSPAAERR